ncbi:MAG: DUF1552 domain-containing protein [Gemmataceae bacterium]
MKHISRRTMLRGVGTAIALPWLESLGFAAAPPGSTAAAGVPKRLAFVYVPNGVNMTEWTQAETGKLTKLTGTLAPLDAHRDYVNVIGGMTLDKGRANGDGPGDHARAMSTFLTGRQPRKTSGADIKVGMSADQHVAQAVGDNTKFPSLELGIERGQQAGNCDSGYSCAYSSNLSWRGESTPNAKETDPKLVFERLFGGNDPKELAAARAKRELYNKSILDFVAEDAKQLNKTLGQGDQRKLDEYLTSVREVEQRIEKARAASSAPAAKPNMPMPSGIPKDVTEHIRLMMDLMVLAFQTDLTRVATFPIANDGSNRPYKHIEVPEGHHDLSHHGSDPKKLEKIAKINKFHVEQLAYLTGKLKAAKEADGTNLLDNIMLVYGSGLGDGNAHNHDNLPILLLGKGGGTISSGRHIVYPKKADTPLMNLYLALFERMGAPTARFGDSTGVLSI